MQQTMVQHAALPVVRSADRLRSLAKSVFSGHLLYRCWHRHERCRVASSRIGPNGSYHLAERTMSTTVRLVTRAGPADTGAGVGYKSGMHTRHDLTDEQWKVLEPLLPDRAPVRGGRWRDHRVIVNGIIWRTRTGSSWRDLPDCYSNWKTVYNRHRRWSGDGTGRGVTCAMSCGWAATRSMARSGASAWMAPSSVPITTVPEFATSRRRTLLPRCSRRRFWMMR